MCCDAYGIRACSPSEPSSPGASSAASGPTAEPAAATPSATVKAVSFDETYRYLDGITVTVTAITHGQLGVYPDRGSRRQGGDPYTVVSASVRNATAAKFELIFIATLRYGKDRTVAYRLLLGEDNGNLILAPGEDPNPYDMGFLVPVADRTTWCWNCRATVSICRSRSPARSRRHGPKVERVKGGPRGSC